MIKRLFNLAFLLLATALLNPSLSAETVFTPWGNVIGMRVKGELVEFEAGLRIVREDWSGFSSAVKYLQRPKYSRMGRQRTVSSSIERLQFKASVHDTAPGEAVLELETTGPDALKEASVYLCVDLPAHNFGGGTLAVLGGGSEARITLNDSPPSSRKDYLETRGRQVRIAGARQTLEISFEEPLVVRVRRDASDRPTHLNDPKVNQVFVAPVKGANPSYQVYLKPLESVGATAFPRITFKATADPDPDPVRLELDASHPGQPFDGIGGNFRLQFPSTDPAVTRYNLEHLPLAWGRVEMPWSDWDPEENSQPLEAARSGRVHPRVHAAMAMAQTLSRKGMPVIVSAWFPPRWARAVNQPPGLRGTALDSAKLPRIRNSLADYLVYLQEQYGVEAVLLSFNEPETGVEVRQTADEHALFVETMGAELAQRNLRTRMLLGDTAHGTAAALRFLGPSLENPKVRHQVGAVGFHTWRGCTPEELRQWSDAARHLGVPLLVTESGPDARLHEYPGIRLEPWFQLDEIALYVQICAFGQPATIMEWQLNTDYSVLTGGGVYGEEGPLQPTQRFWSLKQLGTTPARALALPVSCDKHQVIAAAFGATNGSVAVHLVNKGGQRQALLSGLPAGARAMQILVTDQHRAMADPGPTQVRDGQVEFLLPAAAYVTLLSEPPSK
ncbi:MAG: hypothetical protein AB9869_27515 [Verrucomicrobiia bacterium]